MPLSFEALGLDVPDQSQILGIIRLSLEIVVAQLAQTSPPKVNDALVKGYKLAFGGLCSQNGSTLSSPLYPNAGWVLQGVHDTPHYLLGVQLERRGVGWMFCYANIA